MWSVVPGTLGMHQHTHTYTRVRIHAVPDDITAWGMSRAHTAHGVFWGQPSTGLWTLLMLLVRHQNSSGLHVYKYTYTCTHRVHPIFRTSPWLLHTPQIQSPGTLGTITEGFLCQYEGSSEFHAGQRTSTWRQQRMMQSQKQQKKWS